ncbi:type II secretion system F family protein [Achromobacter sp. GG226]|uniref:type II secretion system F family protein n=1 Tax=Verticiella alkaliphila TaxID=2779529 RepID=UPI001C0D2F0C|nr:type II secretion system F family protein [Verticiella sp. GG226]MBU4613064.1 type II secretion system F family protein [Verticiella sp. GG226]
MVLALGLGSLSLLLLAMSLLLWRTARERDQRLLAERFIDQQLSRLDPAAPAVAAAGSAQRPASRLGPQVWTALLLRAGKLPDARWHLRLALVLVLAAALGGVALSWAGLVLGVLLAAAGLLGYLMVLAGRRQARMVDQLPGFIDAIVRLITIGNSLGAAFQTASQTLDAPLSEAMTRAANLNRSGVELDEALHAVAALYRLREFELLAAITSLALRFGGRSDQVLERMAVFMRDLRQARQELTAMSAEIRLSAWILALLPVGVAFFIIVFNNALFMTMWHDGTGRLMLAGAVVLQVLGTIWLYRMARAI